MALQANVKEDHPKAPSTSIMRLAGFRKLWISGAFEGIGDEASRVVVPIIAVSMLGAGTMEVGILNALGLGAFLVFGLPIGVWVDRLRQRRLMITADIFRAVAVLTIPVAFMAGCLTMWQLMVCVALISIADVVFTTAHGSFIPSVVGREQISDAYARLQAASSSVAVASPTLMGALLSIIAAPLVLISAVLAYILSAASLTGVRLSEDAKPRRDNDPFWKSAWSGLSFTVHHPILRPLFLSGMLINAAAMFGSAATAVYGLNVLGLSPTLFALIGTFAALGGLAASVTAPSVLRRFGIGKTKILASLLCIPAVAMTPLAPELPGISILWLSASDFCWAFLVVTISVVGSGISPRLTPAHKLGTVMASNRLFILGIMPIASLAAGALATWIGVQPVLWVWALLAGASALPIALSPLRHWHQFPAHLDTEAPKTSP